MLFQKFDNTQENGQCGVRIEYATTWPYDAAFVLAAAQAILDSDLKDPKNVRRITADGREITFLTREAGLSLSAVLDGQACRQLSLTGISRKYFAKYGGHVFDRYMDSIEITACCAIAVARAAKDPS